MTESGKDELYRRLEQSRRLVAAVTDETTLQRLSDLVRDLEYQIATIELRDSDASEA